MSEKKNPKLNEILAVEKGLKNKSYGDFTKLHQLLQKSQKKGDEGKNPMRGISRTYEPRDDNGERLPAESVEVQVRVKEIVHSAQDKLCEIFDITASKDWANTNAKANIELEDGTVLLENVPVSYLLWLEKQLNDLYTFASELPTLPLDAEWVWDENKNCYKTNPIQTAKTKQTIKPVVLYEATKEHPAQVKEVPDTVVTGDWTVTKFSGELPLQVKDEFKSRVKNLQAAVKSARERANSVDAPKQQIGKKILNYAFEPLSRMNG